jgi:hypothetical protein
LYKEKSHGRRFGPYANMIIGTTILVSN